MIEIIQETEKTEDKQEAKLPRKRFPNLYGGLCLYISSPGAALRL